MKERNLCFFLTDIDTIYDGNDLPDPNLLCYKYQEYDGKSFRLNNIAPINTYQYIRQIIINEFLEAVNLASEYNQGSV